MDLFDIFQQFRIEANHKESMSRASEAKNKASFNEIDIRELQAKIDHLSLVCLAMSEMLEGVGFTQKMQLSKIEEIDLRDGKLDGKFLPSHTCTVCTRVVAARHSSCMYCGTKIDKPSVL